MRLLIFYLFAIVLIKLSRSAYNKSDVNNQSVKRFIEYLRIDTSKEENIELAVEFWRQQASSIGLPFRVVRPAGKPICIITLLGSDPKLPSIMLNTHMDVVGVEEEKWSHPPFAGHIDEEGNIFGRGAQDCKGLSIVQFETLKYFVDNNITLSRTIYMTLMPDEETGSVKGMQPFVRSADFEQMNVGFALDEGLSFNENAFYVTYVDKRPWQMEFTIFGESGHGAFMPDGVAIEKMSLLLNKVLSYRETQKAVMKSSDPKDFGAYTSVNINYIKGGIATNIVPSSMSVVVDVRLSISTNVSELQALVDSWLQTTGQINNSVRFLRKEDVSVSTAVDDTNPYWVAMKLAAQELGKDMKPVVCPATSDMLYVRALGVPAFGFVPNTNTTSRIHGAHEYVHVRTLLQGIQQYRAIVARIAELIG